MKKEEKSFRPELLRRGISFCLQADCKLSGQCLHYLAYQYAEPFDVASFRDPRNPQRGEACQDYLSNEVQRVGRGFRRALARIPKGLVTTFRRDMMTTLGCSYTAYYRYMRGETEPSLRQAELMRQVFQAYSIATEKFFDTYEDTYVLD